MAFWSALLSRPSRIPLNLRPSLTLFFLMAGAFLLTLVPQIEQLPLWVTISVVAAMVVRSILEFYRLPLPSSGFCAVMALLLLAGIFFYFNTVFGRQAGIAFIAGLLAIKFYELRGPRDLALIIFACFFVVMSALLYSQALELFIYCLIMMWVLTALLMRIQIGDRAEDSLLRMLNRSGGVFLQALPLTIFLFFFFPRYTGKLQFPINDAGIGLNDTVEPGNIASLSRDDREAMYVKFLSENIPTVDTMYWRAMVLWQYHHGIWTRGIAAESGEPDPPPRGNLVVQQITVYPHFKKWLFALDCPVKNAEHRSDNGNWSVLLNGDVLQLSREISQLDHNERYTVTSAALAPRAVRNDELINGTQVPGDDPDDDSNDRVSPEVKALADQLRKENPDDQDYVSAVLHYFRHNHFVYSAAPGAMDKDKDWLRTFLFEKRKGFCEHFASAFAVLMRLEKIPTRVVVGYQGAQFNPYDNTYIVLQSNAHAWDEVWLYSKNQPHAVGGEGRWTRVDPTSILSSDPNSASNNGNNQQGTSTDDLAIQLANQQSTLLSGSHYPSWMRSTMVEMQLRRQQIEANWDDWVFSYDPEAQSRLAQFLGFGRSPVVLLSIASLFAIVVCGVVFRLLMKRRKVLSPVEALYAAFCRSMAQSGVPRADWEGPLAYTERVAETFPERRDAIQSVGEIVAHSRYGPEPVPSAPKDLEVLLKSITAPQQAVSVAHESGN